MPSPDIKVGKSSLSAFSNFLTNSHINIKNDFDIKRVRPILDCILTHKFSSPIKQEIYEYDNRLTFSCPYCGDSDLSDYKKRGNLYLKNMYYKCFNCGVSSSFYNFVKDFKEYCNLDTYELIAIKSYKGVSSSYNQKALNLFDKERIEKYAIKIDDLKKNKKWIDITSGTKGYYYLKNRYQNNFDHFLYDPKFNSIIILNNDLNGHVIGYITRNIGKSANKYYTFNLDKIYEDLSLEVTDDVRDMSKVSNIFNILNIDFNQKITIFEGPFDSFLYYNSIAISGVLKALPFEIENINYWFDNDKTGRNKSIELIKEGKSVFLWKKYYNDLKLNGDNLPKDLNDLIIYSKKNSINLLPFDDYFSNKKLDMFYL